MRGPTLPITPRRLLPLALCLGSLAMVGCPKMPRISTVDPTPSPSASATPTPTPSESPTPTPEPTPNDEPTVRTQAVGPAPRGIAVDGSGNAFVTLQDDVVQLVMSPAATASLKFASHTFPAPAGIVLNSAGTVAWIADGSKVREYSRSPRSLQDFTFGGTPDRLAMDGHGNVWVSDIDTDEPRIGAIPANSNPAVAPLAIALSIKPADLVIDVAGLGWVLCSQNGGVRVMRVSPVLSGNTLTGLNKDFDVAVAGLNQAFGIAVTPTGAVWLTGTTAEGTGQLVRLDRESGASVGAPIALSFAPGRLAIRSDFAWIAGNTGVHKVSLTSGAVVDTIATGGKPAEVFKDSQQDLWLPITSADSIVKLDF